MRTWTLFSNNVCACSFLWEYVIRCLRFCYLDPLLSEFAAFEKSAHLCGFVQFPSVPGSPGKADKVFLLCDLDSPGFFFFSLSIFFSLLSCFYLETAKGVVFSALNFLLILTFCFAWALFKYVLLEFKFLYSPFSDRDFLTRRHVIRAISLILLFFTSSEHS